MCWFVERSYGVPYSLSRRVWTLVHAIRYICLLSYLWSECNGAAANLEAPGKGTDVDLELPSAPYGVTRAPRLDELHQVRIFMNKAMSEGGSGAPDRAERVLRVSLR